MTKPDYWRDKRVLVTGPTGLVGSWLCANLVAMGAAVAALVRDMDSRSELFRSGTYRRLSIVNGDLADLATVERAIVDHQSDTVFHLGAQAIVAVGDELPLLTFESNVRGTYNLLEACRRHPGIVKRVLVASSDKAYGHHPNLPYKEDFALNGRRPYEVSKACADMLATSYFVTYRLPVAIARCGNIYGGGDLNWSRLIPETIRAALQGRPPVLRSDGTYVRDYVHVNDVVSAYLVLAEALDDEPFRGEAFNFSPEHPYTVLEVVNAIQELVGGKRQKPIVLDIAQDEIPSQYLDSAKARTRLGWTARYTLTDGLTETIDWYRKFLADDQVQLAVQ